MNTTRGHLYIVSPLNLPAVDRPTDTVVLKMNGAAHCMRSLLDVSLWCHKAAYFTCRKPGAVRLFPCSLQRAELWVSGRQPLFRATKNNSRMDGTLTACARAVFHPLGSFVFKTVCKVSKPRDKSRNVSSLCLHRFWWWMSIHQWSFRRWRWIQICFNLSYGCSR